MFSFSNTNMLCLDCRQFMFLWLEQKKRKEKKSRCSLSHCWTLSLLSSFQLFLQHMAFLTQLQTKQNKLACHNWVHFKAIYFAHGPQWRPASARGRGMLCSMLTPPSFDKTRKVFVLNRVLHVSDVLRDRRTAKIHPVLSAKVTGIKFLMSNIISIQSSYFSIYVTPLFFLPMESVQSCS